MMFLTSYYDDSGTDDLSPLTVIGGPTMPKDMADGLTDAWPNLLHLYRIENQLHMTDFVRPHGKNIGMHYEMKIAFFSEVARTINEHKQYSLSIVVPQADFKSLVPALARKEFMGPYAFAFFLAVMANQGVATHRRDRDTVTAYLVDDGCAGKEQLSAAHSYLLELERRGGGFRHTGAMGFDTDDRVPALQAADVIAWSARRKALNQLNDEFAPLAIVLDENPPISSRWTGVHSHIPIPREGVEKWAEPIRDWLANKGSPPSFEDLIR